MTHNPLDEPIGEYQDKFGNDIDETEIAQDQEQADNEHWEEQEESRRLQPDE